MHSDALYLEIYQKILHSIQIGEYVENSSLPPERFLSEKYHVSRSTVRQALDKLKEDDFVYTIHGNGSFIKPQIFKQPLTKFYSFTDELKNSNILIHNEIVDYSILTPDRTLSTVLETSPGSEFHKLVRLRFAKDYPLMLETTYLPRNRFITINTQILEDYSLYQYLKTKYDFHVEHATETFKPILPSQKERDLLQIPQYSPCMLVERFGYEDNQLSEYTHSIIRGDKYLFSVDFINNDQPPASV